MPRAIHNVSFQMQSNIYHILNINTLEQFKVIKPTFNITERPVYGHYKMTCLFFGIRNTTKESFELQVNEIKLFEIEQDFNDKYTDNVSLIVDMTVHQLMELINDFKELKVDIQFYPCSNTSQNYYSKPVFTKRYRAIFKNKTELLKCIPKESLIPKDPGSSSQGQSELFITTEFQLIEDDIHRLRNRSINYIFRNCTVRDMILNTCSLFGIKKISMVPPDNNTVYENVIIPPLLSFDKVFKFINDYFGVYNSGYSFYYSDGIMYIYPAYDSKPKNEKVVHVYNGGEGMYPGMESYHGIDEDGNYHIVTNSRIDYVNLQDKVAENIGTHFIGYDVDHVIDHTATVKNGEGEINSRSGVGRLIATRLKTYMQASGTDDVGMEFNLYRPEYIFDWNNKYHIPSLLSSYRGSLLGFKWECAFPGTFKPGYRMYYHSDGENKLDRHIDATVANNYKYDVISGTCLKATYRFTPIGRYTDYIVMHCVGEIMCFMEPHKVLSKPDYEKATKSNPDEGIIRMK